VTRFAGWVLWLVTILVCARAGAAPVFEGGGDVTIALFSTRSLAAVTLTPLAPDAWTAACAQCAHRPLTAPLHLSGATEIFAGGSLRLTDEESHEQRAATGLWHLRSSGRRHEIDAVLTLPSERYVAAVVNAEASPTEPPQSLRALAILTRTYALNGVHYSASPGHLTAQLCDSTQCQAMLLGPVSQAIEQATRETAGETLWFNGHRAEVFFSQNCGGQTEDAVSLWPKLRGVPYLRSQADPYCVRRDPAAWHAEISVASFTSIARAEGWHLPANLLTAYVATRSRSHRALRVVFTGDNGATAYLSASALRFGVGRALGWNQVRSDAYELGIRNGVLIFDGRGDGHAVGLCQAGAAEMASEGKSARAILGFYFPGTAVGIASGDDGWQEIHTGTLIVRSAQPFPSERLAALERTWSAVQRQFPARHLLTPEIIFAPTTELFRQLTTQPGWALASTRGSTIVLQPDRIFRAQACDPSATLRHEMLHVLVEAESSDRAPLWLREGLVEVLAGEATASAQVPSASVIEAALRHPDSQRASQQAHRDAAAQVNLLLRRYGPSTVRGWLSAGVPPGAL
jgi:stage II sporulation protein D